jgi:hypothetical protein
VATPVSAVAGILTCDSCGKSTYSNYGNACCPQTC